MAGFREFAPGQVWFYYNSHATKDLEKRKELGSCTSRPVVIIQAAFYPEWNDIVTVCPMTSSDRRSGVYIDTTILKDGSMIEGGTVLPYLFYNIRTKFLFPMIASNHKRKLLSLSSEDFDRVRKGFYYHLGVSKEVPDYVEKWKHLNDYDRSVIVKDIKLAVDDYEDAFYGDHAGSYLPHVSNNPILVQDHHVCEVVENHAVATNTHYDHSTNQFLSDEEVFNTSRLGESDEVPKFDKKNFKLSTIKMKTFAFANALSTITGEYYPIQSEDPLYTEDRPLDNLELKTIVTHYSNNELMGLLNATLPELVELGISSKSTASRFRKALRDMEWPCGHYDSEQNLFIFDQDDAPEPFVYTGDFEVNRPMVKKNARRKKILFGCSIQEMNQIKTMSIDDISKKYQINSTGARKLIEDIDFFFEHYKGSEGEENVTSESIPDQSFDTDPLSDLDDEDLVEDKINLFHIPPVRPTYKFWETLCPSEANEIMHCRSKNIKSMCNNFHITRGKAKSLKGQVANLISGQFMQPSISAAVNLKDAVRKILFEDISKANLYELLAFCQSEPSIIFAAIKSSNTPSKSNIRNVKNKIRRMIVNDF